MDGFYTCCGSYFFLACRHDRFILIKTQMILLQHKIFRQDFTNSLSNIVFYQKSLMQVVLLMPARNKSLCLNRFQNSMISYQTKHDSFYSLSRPLLSKQIILSNIGFFFYSFLSIQIILPLIICKY